MPLSSSLTELAERIVEHYEGRRTPPFQVYQYEPSEEYEVRKELKELRQWLEASPRNIECETISLAHLFWQALEANQMLETVIQEEQSGRHQDAEKAVRQILGIAPTLADRLVEEIEQAIELMLIGEWGESEFLCPQRHKVTAEGYNPQMTSNPADGI